MGGEGSGQGAFDTAAAAPCHEGVLLAFLQGADVRRMATMDGNWKAGFSRVATAKAQAGNVKAPQ